MMIPGAIKHTYRPYTILKVEHYRTTLRQFVARQEMIAYIEWEVRQYRATHVAASTTVGFNLLALRNEQRIRYVILTTAR